MIITLIVLFACIGFVHADVMLETSAAGTKSAGYHTGYAFTIDQGVVVTHLGVFDILGDGIGADVQVGLYPWTGGAAIAVATVTAGTTVEETGTYDTAFAALASPITLVAGDYALLAEGQENEVDINFAYDTFGDLTFNFGTPLAGIAERSSNPFPTTEIWIAGTSDKPAETVMDVHSSTYIYFGPNIKTMPPDPLDELTLSKPKSRAVFQRDDQNKALILIEGAYPDSPTQIEARAIVMSGYSGSETGWQVIDNAPSGGSFSGKLEVSTGGWYSIEVRKLDGSSYSIPVTVDKIGVGEVFISAGQSNSANYGRPAMIPTHDIVSAMDETGQWRHAYDPQPWATGTIGSPWSRLGDILVERFDCPVGFASLGIGSTPVYRWTPGNPYTDYYEDRIRVAINAMGENRFRAFLWHQGESDSIAGTTTTEYANMLNSIIAQSRIDAGWGVPWGVALASYHPDSTEVQEAQVRAAQMQVIANDPLVFQGADTDNFHNLPWLDGSVHFNDRGLLEHALWWEVSIIRTFFPCDFGPDDIVDLSDFAWLASRWLGSNCKFVSEDSSYGCNYCDLNNDDVVDFLDLSVCVYQWLE